MAQIFRDEFTGPDGQLLETYNAAWVRSTNGNVGTATLIGEKVRQTNLNTSVYARSDVQAPTGDYDVSSDMLVVSGSNSPSVGIFGRLTGTGAAQVNGYQARFVNNGSGFVLARFNNNVSTTIGSMVMNMAAGSTFKLTLQQRGTQLALLLDGSVVIGPFTDAAFAGPGFAGMRFASSSVDQIRIDNFTIDTPETAATGTFSSSLNGVTMTSSGDVNDRGSFASTLGDAAMQAAGSVVQVIDPPSGAFASNLSGMSMAAVGEAINRGSFVSTLDGMQMNASGSAAQPVSGLFNSTLGGTSMSAGGYVGEPPQITGTIARRRLRPRRSQRTEV